MYVRTDAFMYVEQPRKLNSGVSTVHFNPYANTRACPGSEPQPNEPTTSMTVVRRFNSIYGVAADSMLVAEDGSTFI